MPRFKVLIKSGAPNETARALHVAEISTFGPSEAGWVGSSETWSTEPEMTAIVEAPDPEAAETRVRNAVGPHCRVSPPEPIAER
jgi:hypothetical protein